MPSVVATRYARALADVALGEKAAASPDVVLAELQTVAAAMEASRELHLVMNSPAISLSRKRAVVARIADARSMSKVTRNFLFLLVDHWRMPLLPDMIQAFEKTVDERLGVLQIAVVSARPLTDPQRGKLTAAFAASTKKQVFLRESVDVELIGGVVARLGSTVYDGSVKGRLEAMKRRLVAE